MFLRQKRKLFAIHTSVMRTFSRQISSKVVLDILKIVETPSDHTLINDNYYTSPDLQRKTLCVRDQDVSGIVEKSSLISP